MAYSVDPDQMLQNAASDLNLHYLLRPVCLILMANIVHKNEAAMAACIKQDCLIITDARRYSS